MLFEFRLLTVMDSLTFGQGHRKGETYKNGSSKTERKYLDFIVSGQSLGQIFEILDFDLIGTFGWSDNMENEINLIEEFMGKTNPKIRTGRTCFYVCPECGDIGCGAITAKIEVSDDIVIWKDFGYENDYSEADLNRYKGIGPFYFNKEQYCQTFEKLKNIQ